MLFSGNNTFKTCTLQNPLPETAESPNIIVHCTHDNSECWIGACVYYTSGARFFGCTVAKLETPLIWTKTDLSSGLLANCNISNFITFQLAVIVFFSFLIQPDITMEPKILSIIIFSLDLDMIPISLPTMNSMKLTYILMGPIKENLLWQ